MIAYLWLGSPEKCADIRHVTGFSAPDPIVVLWTPKSLDVIVSELEFARAKKQIPHAKVWTPESAEPGSAEHQLGDATAGSAKHQLGDDNTRRAGARHSQPRRSQIRRSQNDGTLALLKRKHIKKVFVRGDFPLATALFLKKRGIRVEVGDNVYPKRIIKTPAEIKKIHVAQQAAKAAIRVSTALIRESSINRKGHLTHGGKPLTSERVRAAIRATVLKHGCLDAGTIVAGGAQGANPHEVGTGVLRANEFIVMDVFPCHLEHGYYGDITRTVMRGTPSKRQRQMYRAVAKAQRVALSMIKPGVKCSEVHKRVAECLKVAGFETTTRDDGTPVGFIHGTGHGVGLEIHEAPTLSSRCDTVLCEGMVVTVEPGLYYPELGGVRIEDTVIVTQKGCRKV